MKCLSMLNTQVAKNWTRFENFLDLLYSFGCSGDTDTVTAASPEAHGSDQATAASNQCSANTSAAPVKTSDDSTGSIGLEFLLSVRFVQRVCDFMLGKKSPLCAPGEKRFDMGGSFNQPNFTPLIKLLTKILTSQWLLEKYPLTDLEKKMFLHADLLKVMLAAGGGSGKQFGQCLAGMCRDNLKMSQKVAKVFIKAITNASYDTVKNYLTPLKPFLRLDDSLKP